jgi:hypothetical protein
MKKRVHAILALTLITSGIACQSDNGVTPPTPPPTSPPEVEPLLSLELAPESITLDQGQTIQLMVVAKGRSPQSIPILSSVTYSMIDPTIARVSKDGLVTGILPGTSRISVTATSGPTSLTASATTTVRQTPAPEEVILVSGAQGWQPEVAHIKAGGTVRWLADPINWTGVPNNSVSLLDRNGAVIATLDLRSGTASKTFDTPGEIWFCSGGCWDPPDFGFIYVH